MKLSEAGEVLDIFFPKKKDKSGKHFGFVRYSAMYKDKTILDRLNKVWIDIFKIRAYLPHFNRKERTPQIHQEKAHNVIANSSARRSENTFADVVVEKTR